MTIWRQEFSVERAIPKEVPWDDGHRAQGLEKAYVIVLGDILDEARYQIYKDNAAPNIAAAGAKYSVRGGDAKLLAGEPPASRTVILEFASRQTALAWNRREEYGEIKKLREGAAQATIYIVDRLDLLVIDETGMPPCTDGDPYRT